MSLTESLDKAIKDIEVKFTGGLSNTSTKKFNDLSVAISAIVGLPEDDIYITSVFARSSNTWNRLSQGKPLSRHYVLGVCIASPDGVNGVLAPLGSFIGPGNVHYDSIAVIAQDADKVWRIKAIATNAKDLVSVKCQDQYEDAIIKLVNTVDNPLQKVVERAINPEDAKAKSGAMEPMPEGTPHQKITYGAPGTGKSHGIEEIVSAYADTVRTTFHPDSDYATFVGCYKPSMESVKKKYVLEGKEAEVKDDSGNPVYEDRIVYSYGPQAFTKAYVRAWQKMTPGPDGKIAPQFLVIEEINRGNCAQIFGDLFQLLDRDGTHYSKYAIEADSDLAKYIAKELSGAPASIPAEIRSGKILKLPPNLYIWATMNTSDQSLFPMDSAFKRRWEWEYIPIKDAGKNWKIVAGGTSFPWWSFIETINKYILDTLKNEDKQLGYFFARPDDDASDTIEASKFVNKVLFYLYNDVFKDYDLPNGFAKPDGKGKFAFKDFFLADGKPDEMAVKDLLTGLLAQPQ